jgi:hypothetical protein
VSQQANLENVSNPRGTKELDILLSEFEHIHRCNRTRRITKGHNGSFTFNHLEVVVEPVVHKIDTEELTQVTHVACPTPS